MNKPSPFWGFFVHPPSSLGKNKRNNFFFKISNWMRILGTLTRRALPIGLNWLFSISVMFPFGFPPSYLLWFVYLELTNLVKESRLCRQFHRPNISKSVTNRNFHWLRRKKTIFFRELLITLIRSDWNSRL